MFNKLLLSLFFCVTSNNFPLQPNASSLLAASQQEREKEAFHIIPSTTQPFASKKHMLSLSAIFKNENIHLKEWIEYHRLIGVDHFYLYNIGDPHMSLKVLSPYIKEGLVTFINWFEYTGHLDENAEFIWALSTQISAYENAIFVAAKDTKWLLFLEIGEYLVSDSQKKLSSLLEKYKNYPALALSSDFFDASKLDHVGRKKLLIETISLISAPPKNMQKLVTKMLFRPDLCKGFHWGPYECCFENGQKAIRVRKQELRINHYANRSPEDIFSGKNRRKLHVDNRLFSEGDIALVLEDGYEIEDQEKAIFPFVPALLKKMEYKINDIE